MLSQSSEKGRIQRIRGMYDSERQVKDLIDLEELEEGFLEREKKGFIKGIIVASDVSKCGNRRGGEGRGRGYRLE